jgi:hypothetical protein
MPSPVFIICCESGSDDSLTGLASLFNVIDTFVVNSAPVEDTNQATVPRDGAPSLRIVATWRAICPDDFEGEFESELRMIFEPSGETQSLAAQTIRFWREKPRHRLTAVIGALNLPMSGTLTVESRIRRRGSDAWLSQSYPIDVVVRPETEAQTS